MVKTYCGARKPRKGQKKGTAKECAEKGQVRMFGLNKVDADILPKLKKRVRKKPVVKKKVTPKPKPIKKKVVKKKPVVKKKVTPKPKPKPKPKPIKKKPIKKKPKLKPKRKPFRPEITLDTGDEIQELGFRDGTFRVLKRKPKKKNQFQKVKSEPTGEKKKCINAINEFRKLINSRGKPKIDKNKVELNKLLNAINAFDFYETPLKYANKIFNDIKGSNNILLEPSAGLGVLMEPFIKSGRYKKIVMNELNNVFFNFIKCHTNTNIKAINKDYLKYKPLNNNFNVIVSNPPFAGPVDFGNKIIREKMLYVYFLIKSMLILNNSKNKDFDKVLYIIIPRTIVNRNTFNISKALMKRVYDFFKAEKGIDNIIDKDNDYDIIIQHQIQSMGDVDGFRSFKKGRFVNIGVSAKLFKIIMF